jgi:hypothetical protein
MDPEFANLIEHLDGLICMARATWQSSSEKYADIARTFRFLIANELQLLTWMV